MEPVLIIAIIFGACSAIVKMSLDHAKWKYANKHRLGGGSDAGDSLTSSELRLLIQDAVEQANAPLQARIDELEDTLDQRTRALPPAS
ncbi:MAG: hypothetical protein R2834_07490 [Rhodothermales bacterium]